MKLVIVLSFRIQKAIGTRMKDGLKSLIIKDKKYTYGKVGVMGHKGTSFHLWN